MRENQDKKKATSWGAKEISVDPAVAAFPLALDCIFTLEEHKNHN